ncbi:MAG TPA: wax ester/triacylglycerol synthase family O-acyltransferase [Thermoanaerobaculia bacterium]|jgi:WS/DGAT/MGAT family acyltransferase
MEQLSGIDATFLYLETPNAPMHIGGVSILDPRTPSGGRLGLDDLRRLMAARLHLSRTFRQRLVAVPLGLGRPYWIDDDAFDLAAHVERTRLPEPGGFRELAKLAAWEFAQPLDRARPLWHLLLVEGLERVPGAPPGSVALITRIHHAAIDGISGTEIMNALYDATPEPREVPPPEGAPEEAVPGKLELLRRTGGHVGAAGKALGRTVADTVGGALKGGAAWGLKRIKPPPFPFTAPRTRLNARVGKRRAWWAARLDIERVKEVKRRSGTTVNDVVLAICAGALRRYLLAKDELPAEPLVAMVPISIRTEEERGAMGNQVSAMLVSLATDEADPAARLARIRESALASKLYNQAIGARTLGDYGEVIPFGLAGVAARLYTRMNLAERHRPIFNLVITNVPGPQVPLYCGGARLLAHLGAAPIFDGMGLIMPVFSYAGTLSIAALTCPQMMPDVDVFAGYLEESLAELERA